VILLVDSYSLLFRAHHALPPMNTQAGEPTSALYGTCVLLLKLLREQTPDQIAFAADRPRPSFRRELYADYKATRHAVPEALSHQLARFSELPAALGAPVHAVDGYEADDVLATLACRAARESERTIIVTGDRDLLQLADAWVEILFIGRRGQDHVRYDAAAVEARFGVLPAQLPGLVALIGDSSDNIPGVPGVGGKSAARWIREHGDAAGVVAAVDRLEPARLRSAVAARSEQIVTYERLVRLVSDLSLGEPPWTRIDRDRVASLRPVFEALEFRSLLVRLDALASATGSRS
jgi:DNA polymerase-1